MGRHGSVYIRRSVVGSVSGIVSGIVLATVSPAWFAAGVFFGGLYGVVFSPNEGSLLDHALTAAALGVPAWVLVDATVAPLAVSGAPLWTPDAMRGLLPNLGAWVAAGTVLGPLFVVVGRTADERGWVLERQPEPEPDPDEKDRVVVLGGGFAGVTTAQRLEERFGPDPGVEITVVSKNNSMLFTPMLPEVAGGTLGPTQITSPLRTSLRRTEVIQAEVTGLDPDAKEVYVDGASKGREAEIAADGGIEGEALGYDHLVVSLGAVPNHMGMEGIEEVAFDFKSLQDAISIRNHVIECFEKADRTDDPEEREALVTFVIAGAGFSGAELAGALNDLVHEMLVYYPNVPEEEVEVVVVHSRDRILPELSEDLAEHSLVKMRERGVNFVLGERVEGADPEAGTVELSSGEEVRTETLVWTAGNRPHPLIEESDLPSERGAVEVDEHLSVPGFDGVWAAGDCAKVVDTETGERHPPTAQHATRAAKTLAENVHKKTVGNGDLKPHSHESQGQLCVIGHQSACAEVKGHCFSGFFAWLMWRAVYLGKLPGTERKLRVLFSWTTELFFPRDIVQTVGSEVLRRGR